MAYEMRAGQGSLFKNDKRTADNQPTLKGRVMLPNGEVRWVSGWSKRTAAGEAWISLSVGDLCQQQSQPQGYSAPAASMFAATQTKATVPDNDDDIPF